MGDEPLFPSITLPDALTIPGAVDIPVPTLEQPTATPVSYTHLTLPTILLV